MNQEKSAKKKSQDPRCQEFLFQIKKEKICQEKNFFQEFQEISQEPRISVPNDHSFFENSNFQEYFSWHFCSKQLFSWEFPKTQEAKNLSFLGISVPNKPKKKRKMPRSWEISNDLFFLVELKSFPKNSLLL